MSLSRQSHRVNEPTIHIARDAVPVRTSSMNHLQPATGVGQGTKAAALPISPSIPPPIPTIPSTLKEIDAGTTSPTPSTSAPRPLTSPSLPRKLHAQSHDELRSIPPPPPLPPPPSHPLPPPPSTTPPAQRPRVASATLTRPRGLSNSSLKPRPRAASNASTSAPRYGNLTSTVPPAARSSGAARRTVTSPHIHTTVPNHAEDGEEEETTTPQSPTRSPQTPEQLMRLIRERAGDAYLTSPTRLHARPSVPNLSPKNHTTEYPPPRSASTRSAPLGHHAPSSSFGSGDVKYSAMPQGMKGGMGFHAIAAGPVVPVVPSGGRGEVGCFSPGGRRKGGGLGIRGDGDLDMDGVRKWEAYDGGRMKTPNIRSYDTESRLGGHGAGTPEKGGKVSGFKQKLKHMFHGFHISVSVSFNEKPVSASIPSATPYTHADYPGQITLRVKNNPTGNCVFSVIPSRTPSALFSPSLSNNDIDPPLPVADGILTPINNLKSIFPRDKALIKALNEWNRHFQHPPAHWVVNFVPRAYIRRGYGLAEEMLGYFKAWGDEKGREVVVEYEPIGEEVCVVGRVGRSGVAWEAGRG
ncbi:hypothetical protein EX30DRAFT_341497 [Ascodesmis nigricans]|uniref:Uncharacterized protein n=1 Tax=Ascodesmis nigricans TaxID=341454 RepID=A0A4S2MVG9_9PEZI|nr:hypothetical protein EX30DRAFT_341497 [Ascodesmis nigricans]